MEFGGQKSRPNFRLFDPVKFRAEVGKMSQSDFCTTPWTRPPTYFWRSTPGPCRRLGSGCQKTYMYGLPTYVVRPYKQYRAPEPKTYHPSLYILSELSTDTWEAVAVLLSIWPVYAKKSLENVCISADRQIRRWGQWKSNRKSPNVYRLAPWPLTLDDPDPT